MSSTRHVGVFDHSFSSSWWSQTTLPPPHSPIGDSSGNNGASYVLGRGCTLLVVNGQCIIILGSCPALAEESDAKGDNSTLNMGTGQRTSSADLVDRRDT